MKIFPLLAISWAWPGAPVLPAQPIASVARAEDAAGLPRFEAATVKPCDPKVTRPWGPTIYPGARITIYQMALKGLITQAFHIGAWQISGGESWMEKDQYDIEGKPGADLIPTIKDLRYSWMYGIEDEQMRLMVQALLIDRFQLRYHREAKAGTVYVLERGDKPLLLQPTAVTDERARPSDTPMFSGSIGFAGGTWGLFNTTMARFVTFAGNYVLHAPVEDRTGLKGQFNYRQRTPLAETDATTTDNTDSFLRLIPEMGLKLERRKGTVEMLVIDHAEKPSGN